jgi:glycosyltransferase involved in cell wall biosynthesis
MLNVLLVYYEPMPAGQTAHVLSLALGLDSGKHRVTVVLPAGLERSIAAFRRAGVEVVPLPLRKVAWPPRAVLALARLIRQQDVDIVHIHSQEAGLLGRVVARMARAQGVIYTPQTIDIRRARWYWLYVLLERALAHATDAIISVNEGDRVRLIRWGIPPHKIVTIPNGIDLGAFGGVGDVDALRRTLGLAPGRPLVMQVARLSAQKAPLAFVDGAAQAIHQCPEAQFALVGEGPLRDAVAARVRGLGLEGHVRLLGWRDEAFKLMRAADVVSLTSRWEGAPYTLLEAMGWSRPVVATTVNGCSEIVVDGETGFLVPPGDTAAWAGRVVDLLSDPVRAAAMGRQGRRRVEERFSLRGMITRTERLYQRVAEAHGRMRALQGYVWGVGETELAWSEYEAEAIALQGPNPPR